MVGDGFRVHGTLSGTSDVAQTGPVLWTLLKEGTELKTGSEQVEQVLAWRLRLPRGCSSFCRGRGTPSEAAGIPRHRSRPPCPPSSAGESRTCGRQDLAGPPETRGPDRCRFFTLIRISQQQLEPEVHPGQGTDRRFFWTFGPSLLPESAPRINGSRRKKEQDQAHKAKG